MIDADQIWKNIWQGSAPPKGPYVAMSGFDVLVLCAREFQPPPEKYPGVDVIYAPSHDEEFDFDDQRQVKTITDAADAVVRAARTGRKILVTCYMGWNRSGLVTALALHQLTGASGKDCIRQVRSQREGALFNEDFCEKLSELPKRRVR